MRENRKTPVISIVLLIVFCAVLCVTGCSKGGVTEDKKGVIIEDLAHSDIAVVVGTSKNSIVLMGHLKFDEIGETEVTGSWRFETWGENSTFSMLPVNTGPAFTEPDYIGTFTGTVFGDMLILDVPLPESESSLGIVLDRQEGENIYGSVSMLPDKTFSGSLKALKYSSESDAAKLLP